MDRTERSKRSALLLRWEDDLQYGLEDFDRDYRALLDAERPVVGWEFSCPDIGFRTVSDGGPGIPKEEWKRVAPSWIIRPLTYMEDSDAR